MLCGVYRRMTSSDVRCPGSATQIGGSSMQGCPPSMRSAGGTWFVVKTGRGVDRLQHIQIVSNSFLALWQSMRLPARSA
jgi:hypothetical protein